MTRPHFGVLSEHQPPLSERAAFTRGYPSLPGIEDGRFEFLDCMQDWQMTLEDPEHARTNTGKEQPSG